MQAADQKIVYSGDLSGWVECTVEYIGCGRVDEVEGVEIF